MPSLSLTDYQKQIAAYEKLKPIFDAYAEILERVLKQACAVAVPEASVRARAKSLSSFAGKIARRNYTDPVREMADLCGGRVIVQTSEQIKAVQAFINANFQVLEREDKADTLADDRFGYRSLHFTVRLHPDHYPALGVSPAEYGKIKDWPAELQVRTWLQHSWADTLHDRLYKSPLQPTPETHRTVALLAALMEEAERNLDQLVGELDGKIANYTAYASHQDVNHEIDVQRLILQIAPEPEKGEPENKPGLAIKLARLLLACGDFDGVTEALTPYRDWQGIQRGELLSMLGYALCRTHRDAPNSFEFKQGLDALEEARGWCASVPTAAVLDRRRLQCLEVQTLSRLGWAQARQGDMVTARESRRQAHEMEPGNPYYLADMLGYEALFNPTGLPEVMRTFIRAARATARDHAEAGIELPHAYFTSGHLSLLLHEDMEALGYYARGLRHVLADEQCFPKDTLEEALDWLKNQHFGKAPPENIRWANALLNLAGRLSETNRKPELPVSVLIVAGGAASLDKADAQRVLPLLEAVLKDFQGEVVSGGTSVGVPGCVGAAADRLKAADAKHFKLSGYIPQRLPYDGPKDAFYDEFVVCGGDKFSPEQILHSWECLLGRGIRPGQVRLLAFGGGPLTAFECRLALALGATVGVVDGYGGAAEAIARDPLWAKLPNLWPLPEDAASLWAFATPTANSFAQPILDDMAMAFHANYLSISEGSLPNKLKPWPKLDATFKTANRDQASYATRILAASGFKVSETPNPVVFSGFNDEEIERMAELEHGRWVVERLRNGWRLGLRDDPAKRHPNLVAWNELDEATKKYDIESVKKFPEILAQASLQIDRRQASTRGHAARYS